MRTLLLIITAGFATLFGGVVISTLWGWFVAPLGAPEIKMIHAVGLSFLIGATHNMSTRSLEEDPFELILINVFKNAVALGGGFLARLFM